jgi:hypothetical protein
VVADLRRRFWVSLALTVPVLALAPMIQELLGVRKAWALPGGDLLQFVLASVIFFYGGFPFLRGLGEEFGQLGGGLVVRRALPHRERRLVGPWCFLDRFGPLAFDAGKPMDVAPHPHIGLQTVTWLVEGEAAPQG